MRRGRHIERRNPVRSPYKNDQVVCGACGRHSFKFRLVVQNGILIDRTHPGCVDTQDEYRGTLSPGPHYGGS